MLYQTVQSVISIHINLLYLEKNSQDIFFLAELLKKKQLGSIVRKGIDSEVEVSGQKYKISLSHTAIFRKRQSTKKLPIKVKKLGFRCEIIGDVPLMRGSYGTLYPILKTLHLNEHFILVEMDKEKQKQSGNKKRVVKVQIENKANFLAYREAEIMRILLHLHAKDLIIDKEARKNYTIMRRLPGEDLFEILTSRHFTLTIDQKIQIFLASLFALKEQVHQLDLVHGDIKLENMMVELRPDRLLPQVNIIDYGFHKRKGDRATDFFRGTVLYAAPEALRLENCTQASDIFSLGKTIYELFFGLYPWYDTETAKMDICKRQLVAREPLDEKHVQWIAFLGLNIENNFENEQNLSENHRNRLRALLKDMLAYNPEARSLLDELIVKVQILSNERAALRENVARLKQQMQCLGPGLHDRSTDILMKNTSVSNSSQFFQRSSYRLDTRIEVKKAVRLTRCGTF